MNRLIGFIYAVCAIAIILWASGCGPSLYAQSSPPPGRTASFGENDGHYDLDLSQGVAIAISCYADGACKDVVVSTDDASIADVKGAAFSNLERNAYTMHTLTPSGLVIVGRHPGKTRIKVKTSKGDKTINVHVIAPPLVGEPAQVAGQARDQSGANGAR